MTGFLDLPPEIRNRIYHQTISLVRHPQPDTDLRALVSSYKPWVSRHGQQEPYSFHKQPPITRTCRTIRNETLPIFYGVNEFIFYNHDAKERYIWKCDNRNRFLDCVSKWFSMNRNHLPLMKRVKIECLDRCGLKADEIVSGLAEKGIVFEDGVVEAVDHVSYWD